MKKLLIALFLSLLPVSAFAACTGTSMPLATTGGSYSVTSPTNADGNCGYPPNQWYQGTSNNGLFASLLTLESTELNTLANAALIVSSVGGSSGLFTNSSTGQARTGLVIFTPGSTVTCTTSGANLAGWFLQSGDGTTFESTTAAPPRSPDFSIPLPTTAIGTTNYNAVGYITLPALNFKVLVQNNCGVSLAASGNLIKLAPLASQN